MASNKILHPLAGSARALRSESKLIGPVNGADRIEVTVRLRSGNKKPFDADKIGALPPLKRR